MKNKAKLISTQKGSLFLILVFPFLSSINSFSQVRQKIPLVTTKVTLPVKINTIRLTSIATLDASFAAKWNQSQMQHDIIGSDFMGKQEIGTAAAERFGPGGHVMDWWFPLDAFKKTIGGELIENAMFEVNLGENLGDYDQNLDIIPTADFASDFRFSLQKATDRNNGRDPLVDDHVPNTACSEDDYRDFRINWMEFEFDLHLTNARSYFDTHTANAPRIKSSSGSGDTVFAYGPWVSDAGHCHKPEIHPAEQVWWRKTHSSKKIDYFLLLNADQSHRFDVPDNFDEHEVIGRDRYLKQVWAPKPLKGAFAIVFGIKSGKERCYLDISRISGEEISSSYSEGQLHYLVYNTDTIAVVKEPPGADHLKISFQNVCSSNAFNQDGTKNIFGFIVLETQVGRAPVTSSPAQPAKGGYQFLKVEKEIRSLSFKTLPDRR